MAKKAGIAANKNILFTCVGRRVSLLKSFASSAKGLKVKLTISGTDTTALSPALEICDKKFIVKPCYDPEYIKQLLKIVEDNEIDLLIPTVDLDLRLLAESKDAFARLGCYVLVSSPQVIRICQDKRKTFHFLKTKGFNTPETISPQKAAARKNLVWPVFLKPWDGYASRGNYIARNRRDLAFFSNKVPNCIVQEFVSGDEYTCDVLVDMQMKAKCVVPRKRLETRGGEVSKGQVVKDQRIIDEATRLVETLGAGPGVITLQLFLTPDEKIKFVEINPRFGGGVPLSIKAGANFPKWIIQQLIGEPLNIQPDKIKDNLIMLRYDSEVWMDQEK